MSSCQLTIVDSVDKVIFDFLGEFTLYDVSRIEKKIVNINLLKTDNVVINLDNITYLDTTVALYLNKLHQKFLDDSKKVFIQCATKKIQATLDLVQKETKNLEKLKQENKKKIITTIGKDSFKNCLGFLSFVEFIGKLFATKLFYFFSIKNIRFKEIAYEINESAIKALGIVSLTSFLIGLVIAYQSAFQLKLYGANIFIVDMLGISILRELAPLITAIVIAGRSGSAFTAQIGAMKITQELDAMRTMGFDPYIFLVLPRIIAMMISMSILIFVADMMGLLGGVVVANIDLGISSDVFLERFKEVVSIKHFFLGMIKGPFFAFLIASIGVYRGFMVKDDTQSIGKNTTKSVVESIFAVIVCDAIFSILFTNLGI